jgi:hypothetical protein
MIERAVQKLVPDEQKLVNKQKIAARYGVSLRAILPDGQAHSAVSHVINWQFAFQWYIKVRKVVFTTWFLDGPPNNPAKVKIGPAHSREPWLTPTRRETRRPKMVWSEEKTNFERRLSRLAPKPLGSNLAQTGGRFL